MSAPQNPPPQYSSNSVSDPLLTPQYTDAATAASGFASGLASSSARTQYDHLPDDIKYTMPISDFELDLRMSFVRRVYTILTLQLLGTTALSSIFILNPGLTVWALQNQWAFWTSFAASIVLMLLAFWKSRSYPINLVFLAGFTAAESYMVGFITSLYDTKIVVEAFFLTFVIFVGLTIFACQSKYDFSQWQGVACTVLFVMIGVGFLMMFFPYSSTAELIYSIIGALLFSLYIVIDTQLVLKKYHLEEEVPAAISLYLDIINLFLYILRILNEANDN
ncbi:uncharacterized protein SAPINGB_P002677 [Magnusiomyces paraingens]|uniref:Uncharacterized protein n=1 Tax=Magnusiomyces paraingens TaxID=2606893 RepID=A0A5E8BF55_9ASCO|nr:uncharacterized protein SAPINGB_P002677 [Saprochaete ingens]VVT50253.1 unnamed protein product [Saprochaete ingens]